MAHKKKKEPRSKPADDVLPPEPLDEVSLDDDTELNEADRPERTSGTSSGTAAGYALGYEDPDDEDAFNDESGRVEQRNPEMDQ
jgi:hypothetical protein